MYVDIFVEKNFWFLIKYSVSIIKNVGVIYNAY